MRTLNNDQYALYKGDDLIAIGTLDELAAQQGVKRSTIYFYSMAAYQRRHKTNVNRKIVIKLGDEDDNKT